MAKYSTSVSWPPCVFIISVTAANTASTCRQKVIALKYMLTDHFTQNHKNPIPRLLTHTGRSYFLTHAASIRPTGKLTETLPSQSHAL